MKKVLFLGNSHTYYHEMPWMVEALSQQTDSLIKTEASTAGGVDFRWHWNQTRSRELLEQGGWDFVVLQNRSGGPLEEPEPMERYAELLANEVRDVGGQPVFYMTWAGLDQPKMQDQISKVYRDIADSNQAILAPVGEAWRHVLQSSESIRLHDADGRHASPSGSYLAACVLTAIMKNTKATGWPGELIRGNQSLIDLESHPASVLQRAADAAIEFESNRG